MRAAKGPNVSSLCMSALDGTSERTVGRKNVSSGESVSGLPPMRTWAPLEMASSTCRVTLERARLWISGPCVLNHMRKDENRGIRKLPVRGNPPGGIRGRGTQRRRSRRVRRAALRVIAPQPQRPGLPRRAHALRERA